MTVAFVAPRDPSVGERAQKTRGAWCRLSQGERAELRREALRFVRQSGTTLAQRTSLVREIVVGLMFEHFLSRGETLKQTSTGIQAVLFSRLHGEQLWGVGLSTIDNAVWSLRDQGALEYTSPWVFEERSDGSVGPSHQAAREMFPGEALLRALDDVIDRLWKRRGRSGSKTQEVVGNQSTSSKVQPAKGHSPPPVRTESPPGDVPF